VRDAVLAVLESLEEFRSKLEALFAQVPGNVTVVLHDSALQLALAQPYLTFARRLSVPAGRRYMSGWYGRSELHVLGPSALRAVAGGPESLKALMLTPERTYTLLVVGLNNPLLPPPFRPAALTRLRRFGWLAEGAAQFFSGQLPHLRAALARRLRGGEVKCPPNARDAPLLAGSLFDLLARERGVEACVRLALHSRPDHPDRIVEEAFGSPPAEVGRRWRSHLEGLARAQPAGALGR
jgi:hypothetical protein